MAEHKTDAKPVKTRLRSDPLVHFFIIAILLLILNWLATIFSAPQSQILVTRATQQTLIEVWTASAGRAPNPEETEDLIAAHVRDEIMFREAKKRGLDTGDTIIRRRLIQKFEFLSDDITAATAPSEQTLEDWFNVNKSRFTVPARRNLLHIFFATNDLDNERIKTALTALKDLDNPIDAQVWSGLGDAFPLERNLMGVTQDDLSSEYGRDFAEAAFAAQPGEWSGPFRSAFGQHLIFVTDEQAAFTPEFPAIQDQVLEVWRDNNQRARRENLIDELAAEYEIVVEGKQP